jgi:MarR family transcriptional repressor of emrRAB
MTKNSQVLEDLVRRLANLMRSDMRLQGNPYNLQPVHFQAMLFIRQANRYSNTPLGLAEYLGLTKGTVSQSLLLLDRKGLVKRYVDESDRRMVRLELSDKGEIFLKEIQLSPSWQTAIRGISPARVKTAVLVLRETLRNLERNSQERSFGVCNTCIYCEQESQRVFRCGLTSERLGVNETRKICRLHIYRE